MVTRIVLCSLVISLSSTAVAQAAELPPDLKRLLPRAEYTVVEFFSSSCGCQRAHDERLKELAATFAPRGVQFIAVDSEATATTSVDAEERASRGYPFPLLTDADGAWADALAARFATFVVVLNRDGKVLYQGGIDSNKQRLTDDAAHWLRDVLTALTGGKPAPTLSVNALGCVLRRR